MILTKKKMYPKTDMLNISNIKKGFHMKKNRKIFSILLVLVLAIQLTAIPAAAASTRTVSRTSTKVTTSYTERKLKLTKKRLKRILLLESRLLISHIVRREILP